MVIFAADEASVVFGKRNALVAVLQCEMNETAVIDKR
jgi:hypothetical protein